MLPEVKKYFDAVDEPCNSVIEIRKAWDDMAASENSLVAWIASNCWNIRGHARQLLAILPKSLDEIDRFALEREWCDDYDKLRRQALLDGAVPSEHYRLWMKGSSRWVPFNNLYVGTRYIKEDDLVSLFKAGVETIQITTRFNETYLIGIKPLVSI